MSDINFIEEIKKYLSKIRGTMPVGTPWWGFDLRSKPAGVQLYQGQILSRDAYPVHWEYVQQKKTIVSDAEWIEFSNAHNGFYPYFSYGDDTNTYRMPKIVDVHPKFVYWGDDVGGYVEAGLPNIIGTVGPLDDTSKNNLSGVFYNKQAIAYDASSTGSGNGWLLEFDAHRSTHIYGQSDTVQPPAVNMLIGEYVISAFSEFSETTEESIQKNIESLELELSRYEQILQKCTTSYVVETWSSDTNWYRKWSDGWIEQGGYCDAQAVATTIITLHIPYTNINYNIHLTNKFVNSATKNAVHITAQTESNFTYWCENTNGDAYWYACGY